MTARMPVVFFGHGSPLIALEQNATTASWRAIAESMPRPKAILCISAHWVTRGAHTTGQSQPPTIHDFGGFPQAMFEIQYPARGDLGLVRRVAELAAPHRIQPSSDWGYDHGCWSVLMKAWPEADVPVVQLSLDVDRSARSHFELGRRLQPLRDEGVLIMGTGNAVHNLRAMVRAPGVPAHPHATAFSNRIWSAVVEDDTEAVVGYETLGEMARWSLPTPEHFWPLLYVLGARHSDDQPTLSTQYIEYGSVDMTTLVLRPPAA